MLYKTRGIALHSVKYAESSLIVKTYTETFGLQSYILKGIRGKKSNIKSALFQPLTLLDMVVYHREKSSIHPVKEVMLAVPTHSTTSDIRKSSIALFLSELIYRAIREEEANDSLFEFLWNSIILLDTTDKGIAGFHLLFSVKLCHFLGFRPQGNRNETNRFFNLQEGMFHPIFSASHCLNEEQSRWFDQLINTEMTQLSRLVFPAGMRVELLDKVLLYYRYHLPGFSGIRSREILHTVLS